MPVGAFTSLGHRLSGIVLAASAAPAIGVLARSLRDEPGYAEATSLLGHPAFKAALAIVVWALAHHVLAGIRHLLSDFDVGSPLRSARRSAWLVNVGAVVLALFAVAFLR
ncbi:MAG: succinate dehydrogenase, cytochrome b556 subunit [Pseudomonadota bacterium]|nr:succinate dehydrogenase, cytochrome b556 subunit [Pseudomonadota bacterium]